MISPVQLPRPFPPRSFVKRNAVALITCLMTFALMSPASDSPRPSSVPAWVKDAVFYQIFPERFANGDTTNDPPGTEPWGGTPTTRNYFGGDLQGIINHLDYLSSLGINTLYLNPIFASNTNHKYQTSDYLKIDPHFGDEQTFKRLVDSCHSRGIRIILDGVFNHTGVDFFAFADLKQNGAASKYRGWYNVYSFPVGPVNKPNYECWWGYGSLPKLMTQNPEVRAYLFGVTRHWMALGIDGWRLDVPNEIPHDFWIEWRKLVKSINPEAYIVGEIWDDASSWLEGDQFDAVMNYRFRNACVDFFARRTTCPSQFDTALAHPRNEYPREVNFALQNLLGSHDTERFLTLCQGDTAILKLAVLFQMTYLGAPMIYYGDEVGMKGGKDPGCRGTMIWDPARQEKDLLEFYKHAIALRNSVTAFREGSFETLLADDAHGIFAFARMKGGQSAVVVINNGRSAAQVNIPLPGGRTNWSQVWPAGVHYTFKRSLHVSIPSLAGVVCVSGD